MSRTLLRALALAALAAPLVTAAAARAQATIAPDLLASTGPLGPDQRKAVSDYVDSQVQRFESGDPAKIVAMRNDICKVLRSATTKDPFRREYAAAFVRSFGKFVVPGDMLRTTNVFIIARHAPTAETIDFLADGTDPSAHPEAPVRIAAAAQLPRAIQATTLPGPQCASLGKRVAEHVSKESHWVVASHEVEAIVRCLQTKGLTPDQVSSLAHSLALVVNDLARRTFDGGDKDLVHALQRALLAVRSDLSKIPAIERAKLIDEIGPSLDRLNKVKGSPPEGFADGERRTAFDSACNTAELLTQIRTAKAD